jgi:hypothetical protein
LILEPFWQEIPDPFRQALRALQEVGRQTIEHLGVVVVVGVGGLGPAAGTASTEAVERRKVAPVLEHFNGTSWSNVTVPVTIGGVASVVDISPTDA